MPATGIKVTQADIARGIDNFRGSRLPPGVTIAGIDERTGRGDSGAFNSRGSVFGEGVTVRSNFEGKNYVILIT